MPDCATTHDKRRNNITPHMFSRHGISTPWIQPNFIPPSCWGKLGCESWSCGTFGSWKLQKKENYSCL